MFHVVSLFAVGVAVVLYVAMGVLALTTGRALPWQREEILRPQLWGSGALLFGAGMALARFVDTLHDLTLDDVVFPCSILMLICGAVLQHVGQRVGR